eukprot:CAMPEP_0168339076 /NCGR_PEP_ID=MMETSP0213-20121227/13249_1 /TAXON_ID=151035 /ORGANISM="Euplotes harpa, Strain FSP1.4" /LENGTH=245 /DNA_ID=CAMNT_0008345045 /DNA_START=225 /DNA_END=962 /DNA_ORIENTATION=-
MNTFGSGLNVDYLKDYIQIFENKFKGAKISLCHHVSSILEDAYMNQFIRSIQGVGWKFSECSGINESTLYFTDPEKMVRQNHLSFKILDMNWATFLNFFVNENGETSYDFVTESKIEELRIIYQCDYNIPKEGVVLNNFLTCNHDSLVKLKRLRLKVWHYDTFIHYPALFSLKESELQHIEYATYLGEGTTLLKCYRATVIRKTDDDSLFSFRLTDGTLGIMEMTEFFLSESGKLEIICKKKGIE